MKLKKLLIENEETTRLSFSAPKSLADRIERYRDYIEANGLPKVKRQDLLEKIITQFLMDDKDFKRWEKAQENGGEPSATATKKPRQKAASKSGAPSSEQEVPAETEVKERNKSEGSEKIDSQSRSDTASKDHAQKYESTAETGEDDGEEPFNTDGLMSGNQTPGADAKNADKEHERPAVQVM
jgi:hypothetical protein